MKSIFFILTMATLSFLGCEKSPTPPKNTLVVATSADYPPYEFFQDGKITGFDIDLIQEIAKKMGKTLEIKDMSFDSIIGALQSGRVDVAISALYETPERRKSVDFSVEYLNPGERVLVCPDYLPIEDMQGLAGKTVGVQTGSTYEAYAKGELKTLVPDLTVHSLSKIPDLVQDVKANRIVGFIVGAIEAETFLSQQKGFKVISLSGEMEGLCVALPKNSPLTPVINQIILDLRKNGFIDDLRKKWIQKA